MSEDIEQQLGKLSAVPEDEQGFSNWLQMQDAVDFLRANARADEFVIYASGRSIFIHSVLALSTKIIPPKTEDLLSWNFNATSSWGVWTTFGEAPAVSVSPPLNDTSCQSLKKGEQLVFARSFQGRLGNKNYYEIFQKVTHVLGLHFLSEKNAYCRIDKNGDIEEVIRIIESKGRRDESGINLVTVKRQAIDQYAAITDQAIVRMFDFTRYRPSAFGGWSQQPTRGIEDEDLIYTLSIEPKHASYMRGVQIVVPQISKEEAAQSFDGAEEVEKQYVSFIAQDWRHKCVVEISCAPGATADYFTKSDLPYELSPAFFKPEVLLKYKNDSDKYQIRDRSITCRDSWHLGSYDINEAGQVHAYLCDLRHLPYEEQRYWKAHNEPPKGTISKRAITADFEGSWDFEYDPLISLKEALDQWCQKRVQWWTLRNDDLPGRVHYPVTTSVDEWSNELLHLDQLVVEGFEERWLRQMAKNLERKPDVKLGSLKLIVECLLGIGFENERAQLILAPLVRLHSLRSKLKGHASGEEAVKIRQDILKEWGSYKAHFRNLCDEIGESVSVIEKAFDSTL